LLFLRYGRTKENKVSVPAAYLGVIIIWSTTPLAIKWSGEGPGFLFGVTARMVISVIVCLVLVSLMGVAMPWHRRARRTYLAAGVGIYAAMLSVYWAAQFMPSGWVSVLFGLTPIVTGVMASAWLDERVFTAPRVLGTSLGLFGLMTIFGSSLGAGDQAYYGVGGVLLAVLFHSTSAVAIKRIGCQIPALATTTGGLMVAVPLFLGTWALTDGHWPDRVPERALLAITYLGVFGSALGFMWYYYVLKHIEASKAALITLVTPVMALLLGRMLNAEAIDTRVWAGTGLILLGLASYQWGGVAIRRTRHVTKAGPVTALRGSESADT
jgi:drug/metabolite transporter (DMT)-like permease